MDPTNREPEEYGHDGARDMPRQRPPRDSVTPDFVQSSAPALARTVQLVSGDFLLTVNPVDGSEIEVSPPGEQPARPHKHTPAERAELAHAARPPVPPGATRPQPPLLERQDERERLLRLLARGHSVRLTGPSGSGRSALLDIVAEDCADLAPDGVVRLSGYRRTVSDLLYDLFATVYKAPRYRPERDELLLYARGIGAVVVIDDLELGGSALDELLDATPECAFLLSATPDTPAPSADSHIEEVFLGGLDRTAGLGLLQRAVDRALTEEETQWAGDLWFESEGLPLRFLQAGALLRQRDRRRGDTDAFDEYGVFEDAAQGAPFAAGDGQDAPLPSLAEAAAPAPLLAARLSPSARETLKFAVALGGEVPHQTHLPALADDTHADAALAELVDCALVSPVGSRYRLAAGVQAQLEAAGYATGADEYALKAAQHYTWWAGHPSVTPERVSAEADAVLAALAVLVPLSAPSAEGEENAAGALARQAAPAFAAGLDWCAWERALRFGMETSRLTEEVGEQAYFHHELGILALCSGQLERARAELEAAIGLRGAVADKRGTVAGRRALALVADRSGATPPGGRTAAGEEVPDARYEESASPPGGMSAGFGSSGPVGDTSKPVTHRAAAEPAPRAGGVRGVVKGTRRNLVAAGAGAALVAVLGTVVTLGMTSGNGNDNPSDKVGPSVTQDANDGDPGSGKATQGGGSGGSGTSGVPTPTRSGANGTSADPAPSSTGGPSDNPTDTGTPTSHAPSTPASTPPTSKPPTSQPPTSRPPTSKPPTSKPPTSKPPTSPPPTESTQPTPPESLTPPASGSASGPAPSAPAGGPASGGPGTPSGSGPVT